MPGSWSVAWYQDCDGLRPASGHRKPQYQTNTPPTAKTPDTPKTAQAQEVPR